MAVSITRKAFVGTGALAAAALAAAPAAALADEAEMGEGVAQVPDWLGTEPADPDEFVQELECDVVVCGLGLAGVSATRAAAEAGASVVVFEKSEEFGLGSKGCCAIGSKLFAERFPSMVEKYWDGGAELLVNEISKGCTYRNNARILRKWLQINGENVDWYVSAPAEDQLSIGTEANGNAVDQDAPCTLAADGWPVPDDYDPYTENMPCLPGSFTMRGSMNKGFISANLDRAYEAAGDKLQVFRTTPAVKLIKDGDRVCGVIAQDAEGNYYKATASQGVVLATGDFMNNEAMLAGLLPQVLESGYHPNGDNNWYMTRDVNVDPCNTGDGHRMALWAGAKMQDYPCSMSHLTSGGSSCFGTLPFLALDRNGARFMNEDVQGQQWAENVRQLPGKAAFQIFDATWPEQMASMPYGHGKNPNATQEDLDARVEAGTTVMADTLEELFAAIDIDAEAALTSVERYNELCEGGSDADFGKTAKRLFPIATPPFYAATVSRGDDLVTMSGIEADEFCRALNAEHVVVPGLYVAGNVQGNRFSNIYPETALGVSVAMALAFGREAGTNAANGI